ncbi:GNAT family N-acetyltransferase [Pantoea sp. Mb-10]|uniref:GNAT family N-acetyltransferase n=1 Tax=unclassified Pantoea TaxID=2630326 RepID=UPI001E321881|nr:MULTISPECIES: GNAT family N-acetyltransferase [unclassified Pantoea]MCE0491293.1 GNAT family N-acetyltransferase [Pantoea sp. Mb-10]MCE0502782.1 GNAT family N-acetyltransferase [Pantoea sp. Pb-8]
MSQTLFREVHPDAPELQPILTGLFGEYAARYGDYFEGDREVESSERFLPPHGLFIVLERDGEVIAMGAYKPYDAVTAELKRIWTRRDLRRQGLALRVLEELERRAQRAGYQHVYLTTGFRQPEAVQLYIGHGYQPQFTLREDMEIYGQPPHDGRLRFVKVLDGFDVAQAS